MTAKALGFVVSGMLNSEREVAEKRIAHILAQHDESVVNGFTDGFINSVKITGYPALFEYVKNRNKSKQLTEIIGAEPKFSGFDVYVNVECKRIVYGKPNGKSWETSDKADEEHTVKSETTYTDTVHIYPGCDVPGVSYTIL